MTRRRKPEGDAPILNGTGTLQHEILPETLPASDTNGTGDGPPTSGTPIAPAGEDRGPDFKVGPVPVSLTESVCVSVWGNPYVDRQTGATFTVYAVTAECRYRTSAGEWRSGKRFRGAAVPILVWALEKAHSWILNRRDPSNSSS
jgi:hypothetical protein